MRMTCSALPQFDRELHRLAKKYRSLPDDLEEFKKVLAVQPLGTSKHFHVIAKHHDIVILKARFFCRYLKGSSLRIVYALHRASHTIQFLEIYFKGDKANEDRVRIAEYSRT